MSVSEETSRAADEAGLEGFTLTYGWAWASEWEDEGLEPNVTIETAASPWEARYLTEMLLDAFDQDAAYVTVNGGSPQIWSRD